MKKLLIVGAGVEQVPAIKIAREFGHNTIVTDISEKAPGINYANKNYIVSTNDPEGNLKIAEKEQIDGVMTLCSETAVPVIAYLSAQLGLPGMSEHTALAATNKGVMRSELSKRDVSLTGYSIIDNYDDLIKFTNLHNPPWVIKPSDSSGQRGIRLIHGKKELKESYYEAKKFATDGNVIIEEFARGPEINVTCLVIDGEVHVLSLSDRITLPTPHFGIANMHLAPPALENHEIGAIKKQAIEATKAIGLKNGISYPQFIASEEGPKLLEIAARIPGGNMREVAMYLSGIDMIKTTIRQSLGEKINYKDSITEEIYPALAIRFITSLDIRSGNKKIETITGIEEVSKLPGIKFCDIRVKKGDIPPQLSNSAGRFGSFCAVGNSRDEVLKIIDTAYKKINIQ